MSVRISHTHTLDETRTSQACQVLTSTQIMLKDPEATRTLTEWTETDKQNSISQNVTKTQRNSEINLAGRPNVFQHFGTAKITSQRQAFQEIDVPQLRRKRSEAGRYENPNNPQ